MVFQPILKSWTANRVFLKTAVFVLLKYTPPGYAAGSSVSFGPLFLEGTSLCGLSLGPTWWDNHTGSYHHQPPSTTELSIAPFEILTQSHYKKVVSECWKGACVGFLLGYCETYLIRCLSDAASHDIFRSWKVGVYVKPPYGKHDQCFVVKFRGLFKWIPTGFSLEFSSIQHFLNSLHDGIRNAPIKFADGSYEGLWELWS